MQGARQGVGRKPINISGARSTSLHSSPQPTPIVHRPQPATPVVPASTRPLANVGHEGLIAAGQQTGTPVQTIPPLQAAQPTPPPFPPGTTPPSPRYPND
jgi:hypothetical protein